MKIIKENFKEDKRRNWYWGRIYFISDNRYRRSRVLWGVTLESAQKKLDRGLVDRSDVERVINSIVDRWKTEKNAVFFPVVRYDAYATDPKEKDELLAFLRENDKV
jgi:hypothetical protein